MNRRLMGLLVALLLVAVACQSDDPPSESESSPVPSQTALPTRALPPTWTSVPTSEDLPTSTLVPTFTPRPTLTITPGITPGVSELDDGSLSVIVEEREINDAIRAIYQNAPLEQLSMSPAISFTRTGRATVEMVFFNEFLNERGTVTASVLVEVRGANVVLSEVVEDREREGILVADDLIRQALALVENGINNAVIELAASEPGEYGVVSAQVQIGRLDIVLRRSNEITPVG